MKLKFDFKSIKIKIWLYMMFFSVLIICLLWLLQIVFLNSFYKNMKQNNITTGADSIAAAYGKIQGQELFSQVETIANASDISVYITDTGGDKIFSTNPYGRDYATPVRNMPHPGEEKRIERRDMFSSFREEILSSENGEVLRSFDTSAEFNMLIYGKIIYSPDKAPAVLIVSSPLQPLKETISILSRQFVYVTVIILVLTVVISLLIAVHVSRPIVKITDKAAKLADGDYNMNFGRGPYTEVDRLAGTLNFATQGLKQAEAMRNELIANISHDLRTPLTMIRLYAEMIRDMKSEGKEMLEQNAGVIIEECDRLTLLVKDILDISKLQSGAEIFKPSVFDLTSTIRRMISKFDVLIKKEGYRLQFYHKKPCCVLADETKIEQVLYNLLSNAIHYTGADKNVYAAIVEKDRFVRVLVRDTGEGIPEEKLDQIWERYYKEGREHKRSIVGTGLGLSIVKSILTLHKANFGVDSVLGVGSTFWFELEKAEEN